MSSSSGTVRRIKERGGSGGKITALKPSKSLTPIPEKDNGEIYKNPNGKENATTISAAKSARKPFAIPRIDKSASSLPIRVGVELSSQAVRWSTSSIPRGRSSSPSDFARLLSDRMSRVSVTDRSAEGKSIPNSRALERSHSQGRSSSNLKTRNEGAKKGLMGIGNCRNGVDLKKDMSKGENLKSATVSGGVRSRQVDSNLAKSRETNLKVCNKDASYLDLKSKVIGEKASCDGKIEENVCFGLSLKDKAPEEANGFVGAIDKSRDAKSKAIVVEDNGARGINKYPSKLHEKLAFLEGKVKRIASDIKRTKDMLDSNNPDASKLILSDIQEKISGVEKAMGHVVNDSHSVVTIPKMIESDAHKSIDSSQSKNNDHLLHSVKGLNHEELEARLFPHRKLLQSRTLGASSSTNIQDNGSNPRQPSGGSNLENVILFPIDENPIALEFLASLNENQITVSKRNEKVGLEFCEVQEMDTTATSVGKDDSNVNTMTDGSGGGDITLTTDETFGEFDDDQENIPHFTVQEEIEDSSMSQLNEIGRKTSTGGWFVSEGESVLLAHDDGSCTFYDIANSEEKAEYNPPAGVSPNIWGDCWLIRAPGSDGSSGRYVVAASSGNTLDSGFCVWDFYTKDVQAFHVEKEAITSSRKVLGPLPNNGLYKRNALSTIMAPENCQWWYKPCGPLLVSTASTQKVVSIYDIRDGEQVMKWEVQRPVITMDYSSPLHWRNRGKVVIAETDAISLWDVNSLTPQPLLSVASSGRKVSALHINNTDAELGGGVRRRVSSSEVEGNDGVFCTQDAINVLDFRLPSGVGLKMSKLGVSVQSIFSRGDSIFLGCCDRRSLAKEHSQSHIQQLSLRKGRIMSTYTLPESNAHFHYSALSQVWGNSDLVMGICGLGLFVFDAVQNEGTPSFGVEYGKSHHQVREIIGSDDLYSPSFDYLSSRVLVISRDRPALWRYLS